MKMDFPQRIKALSHQCRYAGSVDRFYSVAEHTSVGIEVLVETGGDLELQKAFFLHDMPEGPYGDIITPVKRDPAVAARWNTLEDLDFADMHNALGLRPSFYEEHHCDVKALDYSLYTAELFTVVDDYIRQRSKGVIIEQFDIRAHKAVEIIKTGNGRGYSGQNFVWQQRRLENHFDRLFK